MWPDMIGSGNALTRLGRVLFWLGICVAAPLFALGAYLGLADGSDAFPGMISAWIVAFGIFMIGRGLCYVFAGE